MRSILTTLIITIAIGFSFAQLEPVNVQIMVQPPYSPHFEDYVIYENKVVIVLTGKPNQTMQPYQVYFKGILEGSNGVTIMTEESYKPASPVEVPAGGTITLQGTEIDFFSTEHLILSGVDENDLLFGDGLPEGYYHICIRAFDFDTDEPASPDEPLGCSPEFGVFHIDPPQIMLPMDGSTITPTESQNIAFTWTIPVNSPINTEYILTLTELLEGQDPNDAADALTYPPLFETSVSVNSYIYSMADPILEVGRTYVARVRAYDPLNTVVFKNDGYSEVCSFSINDLGQSSHCQPPELIKPEDGIAYLIGTVGEESNPNSNNKGGISSAPTSGKISKLEKNAQTPSVVVSENDPILFIWTNPPGCSNNTLNYRLKIKRIPIDTSLNSNYAQLDKFDCPGYEVDTFLYDNGFYLDPVDIMNADDTTITPVFVKTIPDQTSIYVNPTETYVYEQWTFIYDTIWAEPEPGELGISYELEKIDSFEETITNEYPIFEPGYTYAFTVQAIDPSNTYSFINEGVSEVGWFTYKNKPFNSGNVVIDIEKDITDYGDDFYQLVPNTIISGQMLTKQLSIAQKLPASGPVEIESEPCPDPGSIDPPDDSNMQNLIDNGQVQNPFNDNDESGDTYQNNYMSYSGSGIFGNLNNNNSGYFGGITNTPPISSHQFFQQPPYTSGYINGETVNTSGAIPLANTHLRLVARFSKDEIGDGFYRTSEYNESGCYFDPLSCGVIMIFGIANYVDIPIAFAKTDPDGFYTFDFHNDFETGAILSLDNDLLGLISLRIEIDDKSFCSPDVHIFAKKGDRVELPPQVALIKDLGVQYTVTAGCPGYPGCDGKGAIDVDCGTCGGSGEGEAYYKDCNMCKGTGTYVYPNTQNAVPCFYCDASGKSDELIHPICSTCNGSGKMINLFGSDCSNIGHKSSLPGGGEGIPACRIQVLRQLEESKMVNPAIIALESNGGSEIIEINGIEFLELYDLIADDEGNFNDKINLMLGNIDFDYEDIILDYYIRIGTRAIDPESSYDFTIFNLSEIFERFLAYDFRNNDEVTHNPQLDAWTEAESVGGISYNHDFPYQSVERHYGLEPLEPEIKGRLMAKSNLETKSAGGEQVLLLQNQVPESYPTQYFTFSNNSGFFRFKDISVFWDPIEKTQKGPSSHIITPIGSPKYKTIMMPDEVDSNGNPVVWKLPYGQLKDVGNIFLEYKVSNVIFFVEDEEGNGVPAYLRVVNEGENNPYFKTEDFFGGQIVFPFPIYEEDFTFVEVVPLSNQYFERTIRVHYNDLEIIPGGKRKHIVTVYKKMHRVRLNVLDETNDNAISGVQVKIGDLVEGTTDSNGEVELIFASPGEQFIAHCTPPITYSQKITTIQNKTSDGWKEYTISLSKSKLIKGYISDKNTGSKIEGARVFVQIGSAGGTDLTVETYSGSDGWYHLRGLPANQNYFVVTVTKDGKNPSYIGTSQGINIVNGNERFDFEIEEVDVDLTSIWGFPISVTGISDVNNEKILRGYFHSMPAVSTLSTYSEDTKLNFETVVNLNNSTLNIESTEIPIFKSLIPLKIDGGYQGDFRADRNANKFYLLKAGDNTANIEGTLQLDLASFNFAYQFDGDVFMGDTLTGKIDAFRSVDINPGSIINQLELIKNPYLFTYLTGNNPQNGQPITIHTPKSLRNFSVFGFDASSTFAEAYYENEQFHIGTTLHTDIPIGQNDFMDLKIKAGNIILTKTDINLVPHSFGKIKFNLEEWEIASTKGNQYIGNTSQADWYFDKAKDAIIVPYAQLITGIGVNTPIKNLNIRPDALREAVLDSINGKPRLTLGNVLDLEVTGSTLFNYDEGIGHYTLTVVTDGVHPAAKTGDLPDTKIKDKTTGIYNPGGLEFNSVMLISDNTSKLTVRQSMRYFDVLDVYVDQMMSGEDYFILAGQPTLANVPNFSSSQVLIKYKKVDGLLKPTIGKMDAYIDCNANVTYVLSKNEGDQILSDKLFVSKGTFHIKTPGGGNDDPNNINLEGLLTKTPNGCIVEPDPDISPEPNISQEILIGDNANNTMQVINSPDDGIEVIGNTWNDLVFFCNNTSPGMKPGNIIKYTVHGGVAADSEELAIDDIDTPLGSLSLAYLFPKQALVGQLEITGDLDMGFAKISGGQMAMEIGSPGFFLAFSGGLEIATQQFAGGFMLGAHSGEDLQMYVDPLLAIFEAQNKPDISNGLMGFYAIGQRALIDKTWDFGIVDVVLKAGMGAYLQLNFSGPGNITVGGYGYIHAIGCLELGLCTVGVSGHAHAEIYGEYTFDPSVLTIANCMSIENRLHLCATSLDLNFGGCIQYVTGQGLSTTLKGGTFKCFDDCE